MSEFLMKERVKKGQTADKILSKLGWPKPKHQKLIDMKYNKTFKALAATPTIPLPKNAVLTIPVFTPKLYQSFKNMLVKVVKMAFENEMKKQAMFKTYQLVRENIKKERETDWNAYSKWSAKAQDYENHRDKMYEQCVEFARTCADMKIGMQLADTQIRKAGEKAAKAEKVFKDKLKKGSYASALKKQTSSLDKEYDKLQKEQDRLMKQATAGLKLVLGAGAVMP